MTGTEKMREISTFHTVWNRGEIVFLAAALVVLIGVIVPVPGILLDILWACVLSLTIAVGVIFPAASSTADLKGFAALLSGPALLRIVLVAATCERLLDGQQSGVLIPLTGKLVTAFWPLGAAIICLLGGAALLISIFASCQKIIVATDRYLNWIRPLKYVGIETDLKLGVIPPQQARTLVEKVHIESRLFAHLSACSLLMRTEGIFEIGAILACLTWPFIGTPYSMSSGAERMAQAAAGAVGLAVFSLVPAAISALAGAYLAGKDSLTLRTAPAASETAGRTFTLLDKETGRCEEVALLNPECIGQSDKTAVITGDERIAEFEPEHATLLIETLTFTAGPADVYYRQLASHISDTLTGSRTILLGSRQIQHLPVTVFVNTAIQLAQQGRKLLLVDADIHRKALAQVFELSTEQLGQSILPTGFAGLDLYGIWGPAEKNKTILSEATHTYSGVLVYAPDLSEPDVLGSALDTLEPTAYLFGTESSPQQTGPLTLTMAFCRQFYIAPAIPIHRVSN